MTEQAADVIAACVPIGVALVGIIPTLIANRKKTEKTLDGLKTESLDGLTTINKSVSAVTDDINELKSKLKEHIKEDQWNTMKQARIRIIRFSDELAQDKHRFSKAHFDEMLDDIDCYEKFCLAHPDFKNNKGKVCMDFIKKTYEELIATDGFAR